MSLLIHRTKEPLIDLRYKEHILHIRNSSSQPAYAHHILSNVHAYGPMKTTMTLLQTRKGKRMNALENNYIQFFHRNNCIMQEQSHVGNSPLFQLIYDAQSRGACTWLPTLPYILPQPSQSPPDHHAVHTSAHGHIGLHITANIHSTFTFSITFNEIYFNIFFYISVLS